MVGGFFYTGLSPSFCRQGGCECSFGSFDLRPSTIDRGEAFDVYVTANSSGSGRDDTYACTKITLDGDSSENDHANVTLGASNIEYGPYSVTSQADISDGAYSVTVAIYSKDACNGGSATASASLTVASVNASPLADDDAVVVD